MANQRKLEDYNRLITAMGGTALPVPQANVVGPWQLGLQGDMQNALVSQHQFDSFFDAIGNVIGGGGFGG